MEQEFNQGDIVMVKDEYHREWTEARLVAVWNGFAYTEGSNGGELNRWDCIKKVDKQSEPPKCEGDACPIQWDAAMRKELDDFKEKAEKKPFEFGDLIYVIESDESYPETRAVIGQFGEAVVTCAWNADAPTKDDLIKNLEAIAEEARESTLGMEGIFYCYKKEECYSDELTCYKAEAEAIE